MSVVGCGGCPLRGGTTDVDPSYWRKRLADIAPEALGAAAAVAASATCCAASIDAIDAADALGGDSTCPTSLAASQKLKPAEPPAGAAAPLSPLLLLAMVRAQGGIELDSKEAQTG